MPDLEQSRRSLRFLVAHAYFELRGPVWCWAVLLAGLVGVGFVIGRAW